MLAKKVEKFRHLNCFRQRETRSKTATDPFVNTTLNIQHSSYKSNVDNKNCKLHSSHHARWNKRFVEKETIPTQIIFLTRAQKQKKSFKGLFFFPFLWIYFISFQNRIHLSKYASSFKLFSHPKRISTTSVLTNTQFDNTKFHQLIKHKTSSTILTRRNLLHDHRLGSTNCFCWSGNRYFPISRERTIRNSNWKG